MIGIAITSAQLVLAVDYVRLLLVPTQQHSADALLTVLEEVLQAWDTGHLETVRSLLQVALSLVQNMGYL